MAQLSNVHIARSKCLAFARWEWQMLVFERCISTCSTPCQIRSAKLHSFLRAIHSFEPSKFCVVDCHPEFCCSRQVLTAGSWHHGGMLCACDFHCGPSPNRGNRMNCAESWRNKTRPLMIGPSKRFWNVLLNT